MTYFVDEPKKKYKKKIFRNETVYKNNLNFWLNFSIILALVKFDKTFENM